MATFKSDLETSALHNDGEYEVPDELLFVTIMSRSRQAWWEVETMPAHQIEKLLFKWHLEDIVSRKQKEARERELKRLGKS